MWLKAIFVTVAFSLGSCSSNAQVNKVANNNSEPLVLNEVFVDYTGGVASQEIVTKLSQAPQKGFNIVYFGDSHTAADLMTGALRTTLQSKFGKGRVGFIEPSSVKGQGNSQVKFTNSDITLHNARTDKNHDYLLGGLIASLQPGSKLAYKIDSGIKANQTVSVVARCISGENCILITESDLGDGAITVNSSSWKAYTFNAKNSFSLQSFDLIEVAGLYPEENQAGVSLTALGSNGATINYLQRLDAAWNEGLARINPDLIILAYGTNESYGSFDSTLYARDYAKIIAQIRATTSAQIMVVSNPDSLNLGSSRGLVNVACGGKQHAGVMQVHRSLKEIAQQNQTLFWDWQLAMGGQCSMVQLVNSGKAAKDGVHFTASFYREMGQRMASDLISLTTR